MSTYENKKRYEKNKKKLDRLYKLLENNKDDLFEYIILSDIEKIKKEQNLILRNEKKSKNELIMPEFITNGKEIIIQSNSIDKYVSDVIEEKDAEVLTSNIKDDAPTEILSTKEDDAPTEVLKNTKREFSNIKIVFDGAYKLIYDDDKEFIEPIDNVLLEHNYNEKQSSSNFNIIKMLKRFDQANNSNLYDKYMDNEIEVKYDLSKLSKSKENKKIAKNIEIIAKREAKYNDKVSVNKKDNLKKLKVGISAIAAASLLVLGGLGIAGKLNKNKKTDKSNNKSIEYSNTNNELVKELEKTTYEEITTEEIVEENNKTNINKKELKEETKTIKEEVKTDKEFIKEEVVDKQEETNIKIGDTVSLENTDLYYASTDLNPRGNTKYLDNCTYKAKLISVVYQNQVMELVYNDSISITELERICKDKYGDDVKISINFDVVDSEGNVISNYVGWVNSDDVKAKSKVLK